MVVLVTGLAATGKTTLAKAVAERHRLPLFQKDAFKEAMYDVLCPKATTKPWIVRFKPGWEGSATPLSA
ncbi:hypothetical protein EON81_01875 [bacterium]|nr:MAG: hypothetical protein EON81_01875 [bacterium]